MRLCIFFPGTFYILLRKEVLQEKSLAESRNEFLQKFGETLPNKLLSLPKKILIIILNKKLNEHNSCLPVF